MSEANNEQRVNGLSGGPEDIKVEQAGPHSGGHQTQYCCLLENSRPCNRPASNASYSKRIQGTVAQRKLRLQLDPKSQHTYICEFHKSVIQTVRQKRQRQDSEDSVDTGENNSAAEMVDFFPLQMNTLRKYKKHFRVTSRPGVNKAQLSECLTKHFKTIPVREKEVLTYFIYMVKTRHGAVAEEESRGTAV